MPSFVDVPAGKNPAAASDIQQIIDALKGTIGKGIPLSPTAVNDAIAYAFSAKNLDATNSRAGIFYKADGSVLLQIDKNGVQASPDGTSAAAPVLTAASSVTASQIAATPWTAFTPTATQAAALTLSTAVGRYIQIGKTIWAAIDLVINSAGTAGNPIAVASLPVNMRAPAVSAVVGHGRFFDSSASRFYTLEAYYFSATQVLFAESTSAAVGFGQSPAVTVASPDQLTAFLMYEAA